MGGNARAISILPKKKIQSFFRTKQGGCISKLPKVQNPRLPVFWALSVQYWKLQGSRFHTYKALGNGIRLLESTLAVSMAVPYKKAGIRCTYPCWITKFPFHSHRKPDKIYIQVVPTQLSKHNVFVHTRFVQRQRVLWSQRPHTTSPHTPSPYTTCPHTWEGMAIGGSHRPCLWTG